jgi:serine protease Do
LTCAGFFCLLAAASARADTTRDEGTGQYQRSNSRVLAAFRKVVARPSRSTVRVKCGGKAVALGTVVGADGWILTKASQLKGKAVCRLKGGRELPAEVVGKDVRYDLALLKVEAKGLPVVAWQESKAAPVGNWVASPGLGADPVAIGVVSVAARSLPPDKDTVDRRGGFLGVGLDPSDEGAKIGQVMPKTAASRAGLKVNDIILSIAGKTITDEASLITALKRYKPGDIVRVRVKRGDKDLVLRVTLGKRPESERADYQNRLGSDLSKRRLGFPKVLQHDTVLKPTDCGGPLVDLDGKAVGINIARAGRTESFAIPSEAVLPLLRELSSGKLTPVLAKK